jgi:hypothetical protein
MALLTLCNLEQRYAMCFPNASWPFVQFLNVVAWLQRRSILSCI